MVVVAAVVSAELVWRAVCDCRNGGGVHMVWDHSGRALGTPRAFLASYGRTVTMARALRAHTYADAHLPNGP